MKLIIVESPHKAETIAGFLDTDYIVLATKGHIKNLPKQEFGIIKTEGIYQGSWKTIEGKNDLLLNIKDAAKTAKEVFVATDDDREGERIASDVIEYLSLKKYYRIVFHEVTKKAVEEALKNGSSVDGYLVKAQMARRLIDRILGYPISDMLRQHFKKNSLVSADIAKNMGIGRVSAAALAILAENEEKIEKFVPKKYHKVRIDYIHENVQFSVKSKTLFQENQKEELESFLTFLKNSDVNMHIIEEYKRKITDVAPPPPLITSWLLRGINSRWGYMPEKTMKIAQQLYEGVKINNERVGLITYMRTDSYHVSDDAVFEMADVVSSVMGPEYLYENRRKYTRGEDSGAQEAHEAIRPTHFTEMYMPKNLQEHLTEEQFKVYSYIYYRTIALQIKSSIYDQSSLIVNIGGNKFYAYANKMEFDGWEKIGQYWKNETDDKKDIVILPTDLYPNQELKPLNIMSYPYEEQTPPRYGVGRFITTLEKYQIARPSTVSTVSSQLESKDYIEIINSMQKPTVLGMRVYGFLQEYSPLLINLEHAKEFEENLDKIANGLMEPDTLIGEYEALKDEMSKNLNYVSREAREPEEWMITKAKEIAKTSKELLKKEVLESYTLCLDFIKRNGPKQKKIGPCPACKQDIVEGEKNYYCKNKECKFTLWKNNITKFFERFGKFVPEEELLPYLEIMLKKKKCFVHGLFSNKTQKTFSAFILPKYDDKYNKWDLQITFPKNGEKIDERYYVDRHADFTFKSTKIAKTDTIDPEPALLEIDTGDNDSNTDHDNKSENKSSPNIHQHLHEINDASPRQKLNSDIENITRATPLDDNSKRERQIYVDKSVMSVLAQSAVLEQNKQTRDIVLPQKSERDMLSEKIEKLEEEKRMLIDANKKDHLTRAFNRATLDSDLLLLMAKKTKAEELYLGFLDIDHFKSVNDNYSHQFGDEVLKSIVNVVFATIDQSTSSVYRYGGEEFAILGKCQQKSDTKKIMEKIRKNIEATSITHSGITISCTVSIGISFFGQTDRVGTFMKRADEYMYMAKNNGRNRVESE